MFKPVWTLLVAFRRSPVFSSLALAVLGVGFYSAAVVYVDQQWLGGFVLISAQLHVLLGLVLERPFIGALVLHLDLVAAPRLRTIGTDARCR